MKKSTSIIASIVYAITLVTPMMASAAETSETGGDLLMAVYATAEDSETDAEEIKQQFESNSIYTELTSAYADADETISFEYAGGYINEDNNLVVCVADMDKQQVADYSVSIVNSYVNEAYLYNKDLKTYYTEDLHMSEKQFFDNCYKQGEDYIKKMLIVGALAEYEKCSIDEEEVLEAFELQKRPSDEAYTYMEYQLLTSVVTAPYIINDDK